MPIEFQCPKCNKRLRTGDEHAGRQVKCPSCGEALSIPGPTLPADLELEPLAPSSVGGGGANVPWNYSSGFESSNIGQARELRPTPLDIGDTLGTTWTIFKQQWKTCIGAMLVVMLISFALQFGFRAILPRGGRGVPADPSIAMLGLAVGLVSYAVNLWLQCGIIYLMLRVARGEPTAAIADVFGGGRWLLNYFVATLLFTIILFIGFLLLIIPGVILALMLWPYQYLIVDRNLGITESLSAAREITKGNKLSVFLMFLLITIVGFLLIAITIGLGALVVVPYVTLAMAVTYLKISGQRTAADAVS